MLRAVCHERSTDDWTTLHGTSRVAELIATSGNVVWITGDVRKIARTDLHALVEELGLHPLAVEDAVSTRQRPKLEQYENHLFAVLHQLDTVDGQLEATQLACFIGARYVLALHAGADRTLSETERRWRSGPAQLRGGVAALMHALLDAIVDDYQSIADVIENSIEDLEEAVLADPNAKVETSLYAVKQQLARFRRYVLPVGRILDAVVDPSRIDRIPPETSAYFRDVDDHLLRIADQIRNVQELADAAVDLHRSAQSQALNEVTKKLTGWAAVIAVPTFIASVYGMNFHLVPDNELKSGFLYALTLMAVSAFVLYLFFKRKGWL